MLVGLKRISIALGLFAAASTGAQAQGGAPGANQAIANAVASSLRQSPVISGYRIEIEARNGAVTLRGAVATQAQKADAIARVQSVPGVTAVADQIAVSGDNRLSRVQYQIAHGGGGLFGR